MKTYRQFLNKDEVQGGYVLVRQNMLVLSDCRRIIELSFLVDLESSIEKINILREALNVLEGNAREYHSKV